MKMTSLFVMLAAVRWTWMALRVPLNVLGKQIYGMVRDQKYLVGKKLRSMVPRTTDEGSPIETTPTQGTTE